MDETLMLSTLADSNVSGLVGIMAGHQYEFGWGSPALTVQAPNFTTSRNAGKRLWMTEWSVEKFLNNGQYTNNDIYPSLALAKVIHTDFAAHGLNAYVYWWSSALVNNGSPSKALWTLAQFSRFIRPGWHRVDADTAPTTDILLSAYLNASGTQTAIVAINMGTSTRTFNLTLDSGVFSTVTPTGPQPPRTCSPCPPSLAAATPSRSPSPPRASQPTPRRFDPRFREPNLTTDLTQNPL